MRYRLRRRCGKWGRKDAEPVWLGPDGIRDKRRIEFLRETPYA